MKSEVVTLTQFFWIEGDPSLLIAGTYHPLLVLLSVVIAILISCVAMQVAGIARNSQQRRFRYLAVTSGALALGAGVWSMHFIGMLAFGLPTHVEYDLFITLLSVVPAVLASAIALEMLARKHVSGKQLFVAGILVGAGIGTMHYSGMAAMKMSPILRYDPVWFVASIIISVLLAWFALWLRFGLRENGWISRTGVILLSGTVMGCAVASMHYVAMKAARFIGEHTLHHTPQFDINLIIGIASVTLALSLAVLIGNLFLRFRMLYSQLQFSELRQKAIVDTAVDAIITTERDGTIATINPSVESMFGWQREELVGRNITMLMPESQKAIHEEYLSNYLSGTPAQVVGSGRETMAQRKDSSIFPIRLAVGEMTLGDRVMFVEFITDISEQKHIEQLLEQHANHDALTNLPNRRQLFVMLPKAMAHSDRSGRLLALLFIDLDGFKQINDQLGHDLGDMLLMTVAERLVGTLRATDLVSRIGGDEFIVVIEDLSEAMDAHLIADKLLAALAIPLMLKEHPISIQASIGISFYEPGSHLSVDELVHRADTEMYAIKHERKKAMWG